MNPLATFISNNYPQTNDNVRNTEVLTTDLAGIDG